MPIYNKLVRDQIIEIIDNTGKKSNSMILSSEDHLDFIKEKLFEEVEEYKATTNKVDAIEELADILELIHAALQCENSNFEELDQVRIIKKEKKGGFNKGIFLIDVVD
ncbi:nucleoside triphosphate pyrophosphohydrolase [Kurthia sibirica]|uniref:Phosphoribosyl-ATP pyrophosphohydrolase n=1 Tax=Kurthia sibirica TaxID=202750 RepID=A0A2U3AIT8_9BACL|nr:nucleoside triphosphate pyrophosphohydrolase [Kurthia sibirica]PWI24371.1 phosphoribosyl-ATP pyrophosphohydrolase [Kurthia sibirica]GEK33788.1 phosphoribosyl-ATP pyrophosphohydrolase [Kurthia sibirica]